MNDSPTISGESEYMEIGNGRILIEVIVSDVDPSDRVVMKHTYRNVWYDDHHYEATILGRDEYFLFTAYVENDILTLSRDNREWVFARIDTFPDNTSRRLEEAHRKINQKA